MYLDDSCAKLTEFEGSVPWMYLDTRGIVTVGVGRALEAEADALLLPFQFEGQAATSAEIKAEYLRVRYLPPALLPARYRSAVSPELDAATIRAMLYAKVHEFDGALTAKLDGYRSAPDAAKVALLDMAYNLGPYGLLEYRKLCDAVQAGDWTTCAAECWRNGPSAARNEWTREQFLSCVPDPA